MPNENRLALANDLIGKKVSITYGINGHRQRNLLVVDVDDRHCFMKFEGESPETGKQGTFWYNDNEILTIDIEEDND